MRTKKTNIEPENKDQIERIILFVYTAFSLFLIIPVVMFGWSDHILLPLFTGVPVSIYMHIRKSRTYRFRACVTTALIWINFIMYAMYGDDFEGSLTSMTVAIILLILYSVPTVFHIVNLLYTVLLLCRLFIAHDSVQIFSHKMLLGTRVLSVYVAALVAYYIVNMRIRNYRRQLRNMEALRKAEQSKDDFVANVSHEIRTPVNTICGMSEIVLQNNLPDDVRTYVYGIQTAGRSLLSIVSNILDFSELQSGNISIVQDSYSITSIVNDIINTANAKNNDKNLELVVDCDPCIPSLLVGDRQKIYRAIMNIVDNAFKFTDQGGVLLRITSRLETYGVNLCVTVKDTGIGIRQEHLEKIFNSFNQADTSRSRAEGGIGLGLAISKAIVTKMNGFLQIESVYGEGTEVRLTIPQGVEKNSPCITVKNPGDAKILIYLQMDKYKYALIREGYAESIERMTRQFGLDVHCCSGFSEVRRRMENEEVTHLFVSWEEYCENRGYFEEQAGNVQTILILDRKYQPEIKNSRLLCIYAPFYAMSIASVLNGESVRDLYSGTRSNIFVAPDVHILVVDDNLMNLRVVEGLLSPYKIKISTALSGMEALKKVESRNFDFIFMDHMMPGMDGVETFHRIREKNGEYYRNVPIIALTANAVGNAREMFLNEGFDDYISKPIEMSALEHILRKYIPENKMVFAGEEIEVYSPKSREQEESQAGEGSYVRQETQTEVDSYVQPESDFASESSMGGFLKKEERSEVLELPGIDVSTGINYCGGTLESYLEIVRIYYDAGEKNIRDVWETYSEGDWKKYIILTHTIKSTSKSIGALELSELSRQLEADAKDGKVEEIGAATEDMLAEYGRVLQVLAGNRTVFPQSPVSGEEPPVSKEEPSDFSAKEASTKQAQEKTVQGETLRSALPGNEISEKELAACFEELAALLGSFDSDAATEFLERQGERTYRGELLADLLKPVYDMVQDFDFMGAEEALAGIRKQK